MSRAFMKEDAGDPDELPERPQSLAPNYVTSAGIDALRRKAVELKAALSVLELDDRRRRAPARDLKYYESRIANSILVDSAGRAGDEVRFGATVTVVDDQGGQTVYAIVGQDQAEQEGSAQLNTPGTASAPGSNSSPGTAPEEDGIGAREHGRRLGGMIAWDSGLTLALIGARLGDVVTIPEGEATRRVKVVAISYQ